MKLAQLSLSDLLALRTELHNRILTCYKDGYLVLSGKKKDGLTQEQYRLRAVDYDQKYEQVKAEIDHRLSLIEYA